MRTHSQNSSTELLDFPRIDVADFGYEHGVDEDIDLMLNHHSPYDIEDDSQEFYSHLVFGRRRNHEKH
ncbi:MAG: hypothetical protein JST80_02225 [Bdellovibrionales bacterium]|nr:hypothetical protein [Bdellovibrionales bacterium]